MEATFKFRQEYISQQLMVLHDADLVEVRRDGLKMDNKVFDNIEIAPPSVVKRAAHDFASAVAETPEFKAFEQASDHFRQG
jgi:hypothetical protein